MEKAADATHFLMKRLPKVAGILVIDICKLLAGAVDHNEAARCPRSTNVILPPTRQYNEAEIRQAMVSHGIDGVLVVNVVGDTGVQQQYAGTIANTSYSGSSSGNAMVMALQRSFAHGC